MQHHRHAEAAVRFFLERFSGPVGVPVEGICLHVHARYDTAASPADEVLIAHRVGSSQGPPLHFHLFCSTGSGSSGYHYDALLHVRPNTVGMPLAAPSKFPRNSLLKRKRGDGLGRAV